MPPPVLPGENGELLIAKAWPPKESNQSARPNLPRADTGAEEEPQLD
jgi:hypothetical protein